MESMQNLLFHHSTQYHMETDGKLVRNEAGLSAEHETLCSTCQHSTTRRSDGKLVRKEVRGLEFSAETAIPAVRSGGLISQFVREKCARHVQRTLYFSQAVKREMGHFVSTFQEMKTLINATH